MCVFVQPHGGEFCFFPVLKSVWDTVGVRDFVLSLMKCVPKGTEPLQPSGNHPNTEASATLRREIRFCFLKSIGI